MKGSEYVLKYLKEMGVNHAFLITGGSIAPMVDAFDCSKIWNISAQHTNKEQL